MRVTTIDGPTIYLDEFGFFKERDVESPADIRPTDIAWGFRVMHSGHPRQTGRPMMSRHIYRMRLSIFAKVPLIRLNLKKIV